MRFSVLYYENLGIITQRIISEDTGISIGLVKKQSKKLLNNGLIDSEYQLTIRGKAALEIIGERFDVDGLDKQSYILPQELEYTRPLGQMEL